MSKRWSTCAYSGGHVCEVTGDPSGVGDKTRIAMRKSDMEMVTNGHGENQEVRLFFRKL